ncbi:MAG: trypsin-like peptidase domain-containing protein [Clostridia bacterium]|nr:trypsin-like peptidase domain-containing protein [Clostridia bacterium]
MNTFNSDFNPDNTSGNIPENQARETGADPFDSDFNPDNASGGIPENQATETGADPFDSDFNSDNISGGSYNNQRFEADPLSYNGGNNFGETPVEPYSAPVGNANGGYYGSEPAGAFREDPTDFGFDNRNNHTSGYGYTPNIMPEEVKKPKRRFSFATVVVSILLSAAVAFGSCYAFFRYSSEYGLSGIPISSGDETKETSIENVNINIDEEASSIAQAVSRKCNKSVVGIRTTVSTISFFGGSNSSTGEGSGVVYSKDGYIITNYHVIKEAVASASGKIDVYLESVSTKPYSAKVIGYNIASDLAVLKISASGLSPVQLGDSDKLSVGQYAITIGAPGGLEFMGSVTYGVISGLNRVVSTDSSIKLIQTDAAINPGNSGGALLDETGSLIGINSSKIVAEEFEGMGFAIPVNTVKKICDNIISNKDKAEPYVGITVSESYSGEDLQSYGYPAGAVVLSVAEGSTAESCGIKRGDIITKFNGTDITDYSDYYKALKGCKPGSEVEIMIYRGGMNYRAKITIASNTYSGD